MKILFLSTHNFATNPRFVKEVKLALDKGFEVEIICFEFNNWSYSFNQQLKEQLSAAKITIIPANRRPFWPWISSVLTEQTNRFLGKLLPLNGKRLSQAVSRRSNLLIREIRKKKGPYDLVVGHNPGALFPAWFAGNLFNCNSGFDIEDYHPGEGINPHEQALTKKLIGLYLPKMDYVTFAAPLMRKRTKEDIGLEGKNWVDVLNFFPKDEFTYDSNNKDGKLKIVWFSQNVNYNRGLEQVIPVLKNFQDQIELTLIGNKKEPFFSEYVAKSPWVKYLSPMSQKDLHQAMNAFDIGLAIEPGKDHNNTISLANKLITYFQAGLFVLASNTPSHVDFFSKFVEHGIATSLLEENLEKVFTGLSNNRIQIRKNAVIRNGNVQNRCWENEAKKLTAVWEAVVGE